MPPAKYMRPDPGARPEYIAAFRELVNRIGNSLAELPKRALPIRMYVAGGAALHLYTGERVSRDIDATFSHRIALPENLVGPPPGSALLRSWRRSDPSVTVAR